LSVFGKRQYSLIPALPFSRSELKTRKPFGNKYIDTPATVGEHLRKRRLALGLLQREVAEEIGVTDDCVRFWENGQAVPTISHVPKIIWFLGYNPVEVDNSTSGGQISAYRVQHGFNHKRMGKLLGLMFLLLVDGRHVNIDLLESCLAS
jgi:DNA-binding XRE family transcriptional regulator